MDFNQANILLAQYFKLAPISHTFSLELVIRKGSSLVASQVITYSEVINNFEWVLDWSLDLINLMEEVSN